MQVTQSDCHVAVFPFPFSSHAIISFNLMQKAAEQSPEVLFSFLATEKCINSLFSARGNDLPINIKPFVVDDGIPEGFDLDRNPFQAVGFFMEAVPQNFRKGMEVAETETGRKITCILADSFISDSVRKMDPPWVAVWPGSPHALSAHFYTDLIRQIYGENDNNGGREIKDAIPGLSVVHFSDMPPQVLPQNWSTGQNPDPPQIQAMLESIGPNLPKAKAVVLNAFEEINAVSLHDDFKSKFRLSLSVGFLSLPVPLPPSSGADETGCIPWLDEREAKSVAYIGFGTMTTPTRDEYVALAQAIEDSGISYLWSLKDESVLPDGFLDRTRMQGKVVPWAPQSRVLAHKSVGVHVTHAGYNSVCESILCGVPMICRSIWGDHHIIARIVDQEWKIGVRVEDGVITKDEMIKCFKTVLEDEKGKKMRDSINALKEVVLKAAGPDGSAARNFKLYFKSSPTTCNFSSRIH